MDEQEHERDADEAEDTQAAELDLLPPATVWLVSRETGQKGWQGTLTLETGTLAFRPEDGGAPRLFAFEEIRKANRVLGSPVLELRLAPTAKYRLVGFYFVRPPDLEPPMSTTPKPLQKRHARKKAVLTLRAANTIKLDDVRTWVRAIRRAKAVQQRPD
jgi:hypothetical protein